MDAVDFLHYENPLTWTGVELATLGVQGQLQANYATQPAVCQKATQVSMAGSAGTETRFRAKRQKQARSSFSLLIFAGRLRADNQISMEAKSLMLEYQ
ncbi:hypothetical protein TNCV_89611 [Trichonephila clavipes]|nr:hypothetical protein TNCV_89611 [Trichonephila clavipes]